MADHAEKLDVTRLLMERERNYVKIHRCEVRIAAILGDDYPYPPLPYPPSLSGTRQKAKARKPEPPPRVRLLDTETEDAYQLIYMFNGERETTLCNDISLLRALLADNSPELTLIRIATAAVDGDNDYRIIKVLWPQTDGA